MIPAASRIRFVRLPFLSASVALLLSGCGDSLLPSAKPASEQMDNLDTLKDLFQTGMPAMEKPKVPVRWTLTDEQGRSLDATIIGKSSGEITLVRTSDGQRFDLPIGRLSQEDQRRVNGLDGATAPAKHPMESSFFRMRQRKLDEVEVRIKELYAIYSTSDSAMKRRSALSEIVRLEAERERVRADLRELERF